MMNFIKKLLMKIRREEDLSELADKLSIKKIIILLELVI